MAEAKCEMPFLFLSQFGIIADIVVIAIMWNMKNMRKLSRTLYVNCMVAQFSYIIFAVVLCEPQVDVTSISVLYGRLALLIAILGSIFIIVLDWFLADYAQRHSEVFERKFAIALAFPWVFSLVICLIQVFCQYALKAETFDSIFVYLFYIFFTFTIFMQILRIKRKCDNRQSEHSAGMLNLATVWLVMYLPYIVILSLALFHMQVSTETHFNTERFIRYSIGLQPIVNVVLVCFLCQVPEPESITVYSRDVEGFVRIQSEN